MKKFTSLLFIFISFASVNAQWTADTSVNTLVSSHNHNAGDMNAVATSDGRTFVAFWKSVPAPVNFELRVQLLDENGMQKFGPEGILVSNTIPMHTTGTLPLKLVVDTQNNLYVGLFGTGPVGNLGYHLGYVFKVSPTGTSLWNGSNGINLGEVSFVPSILPLANHDVLVHYMPDLSQTAISKIQRFTETGTPIWSTPISVLPSNGLSDTAPADMYELSNQDFMVVFHTRLGSDVTNLYAQKYNAGGVAQWTTPTQLSNKRTSYGEFYSGAQDGDVVYYAFSGSDGIRYDSFVQRINPDGSVPWGINGKDFDINQTLWEKDPKIVVSPGSQYIWAISTYTPSTQDLKGEYVQKFDKITGARQFTDNAKQVFAVDNNFRNHVSDLRLVNDQPFFLIKSVLDNSSNPTFLYAVLLNSLGDFVWPEHFLPVATFAAPKTNVVFTKPVNNTSIAVFVEPKVSGQPKIYAQKFTPSTLSAIDFEASENAVMIYPNPAHSSFTIKVTSFIKNIAIYNMLGQKVFNKDLADSPEINISTLNWSRGTYIINIESTDNKIHTEKLFKE